MKKMKRKLELSGKRFGRLTVIRENGKKNGRTAWLCKCDCGNYTTVQGSLLNTGKVISCGCFRKEQLKKAQRKDFDKDLLNKKIGKLTIVEYLGNDLWKCKCECGNYTTKKRSYLISHKNDKDYSCGCSRKKIDTSFIGRRFGRFTVVSYVGDAKWLCRCDCGNTSVVEKAKLLTGRSKSCGCLRDEERTIDITGKKFNHLTAICFDHVGDDKRHCWKFRCDCGNEIIAKKIYVMRGELKSCGCISIAKEGSSEELEIKNYILSLNKNIKIEKTREILDGKEIDLYLPEYNLGIEFNGSMFHATVNSVYDNVDKLYHFNKFKLAKEKGVHLINIFDVDWESNKEKIKMYLKSLLIKNKVIYARKCALVHVDYETYKDFCDKYHLQGASRKGLSKYIYGLYYNNELISVMCFGNQRFVKNKEGYYELHRYCVKDGYTVIGGANKLHKYFERTHNVKQIVSYSDNDFFSGNIYDRLGYTFSGYTNPRYYWYLNGVELKREKCQLKYLKEMYKDIYNEAIKENASNKEIYVMTKLNASQVYRSGNTKWLFNSREE